VHRSSNQLEQNVYPAMVTVLYMRIYFEVVVVVAVV